MELRPHAPVGRKTVRLPNRRSLLRSSTPRQLQAFFIAAIWMSSTGLVPKLVYPANTGRTGHAGAEWSGAQIFALDRKSRNPDGSVFLFCMADGSLASAANIALMVLALLAVAVDSPHYLQAAFNPVTLNLAVIALSVIGWIASRRLPSSRRCLRRAPGGQA